MLESNMTRRIDFALFMVEAVTYDALVREPLSSVAGLVRRWPTRTDARSCFPGPSQQNCDDLDALEMGCQSDL
jgi:hypothetical protein